MLACTGSVTKDALELLILLPPPMERWNISVSYYARFKRYWGRKNPRFVYTWCKHSIHRVRAQMLVFCMGYGHLEGWRPSRGGSEETVRRQRGSWEDGLL